MKNLLALFWGLIFFASCTSKDVPKNLIDRDDMVNVLIDMHLADASLDYAQEHNDSLLMFAKSRYQYIFKKYDIDSATFTQSLNFYSKDSEKFAKIYKNVLDSLERMNKPEIPKIHRVKRLIPDSLRFKKVLSTRDSLLARNNKADSLKAKQVDSLRNISIKSALLKKGEAVKDTAKAQIAKVKPLDIYLKKTDSLSTAKLLEIGIDF